MFCFFNVGGLGRRVDLGFGVQGLGLMPDDEGTREGVHPERHSSHDGLVTTVVTVALEGLGV